MVLFVYAIPSIPITANFCQEEFHMPETSSPFNSAPKRLQDTSRISDLGNQTFMVTFVSKPKGNGKPATLNGNGLLAGTIINREELLQTNEGRVEIRDNFGQIFRLREESTFQIELTEEGFQPVYDGFVFKFHRGKIAPMVSDGKYRTSCYDQGTPIVIIEPVDETTDKYFSFSDDSRVYEYDESGRKFTIVALDEDEEVELHYDVRNSMRTRYVAKNRQRISDKDLDRFSQQYMNDRLWI
ncbi:hypothetical protein FD51_GL001579 [Lacticaseibacillus zeae DSM 20178 = KCTC 3804]|uniref:Uncharacterized protein n=2 Tax=Lacticaseibacillus zeae TaxID=57037 RepID=A0A0R1EVG3_LACZE|nr:hypothetical protein FD51_GL001579 [Lacticaseibacillus zeae DSM 20178 = KCTC 3804]